jgi:3-oxoadipate enol-lactonase
MLERTTKKGNKIFIKVEEKMLARINNIDIHYEIEGPEDAPLVTFSHSLAANMDLWELQLPVLRNRYRILRLDTRGHGGSSAPPGPYSIEMLATDAIGLLDLLAVRRTHFVGISMGGMIAQVLARKYPERIAKLVLCDTVASVSPEMGPTWEERIQAAQTGGMEALADQTLERWLSREFRQKRPEIADRIRNMILQTSVAGYTGCCRAISTFDFFDELTGIGAPTLIITGEKDEHAPVSVAESIQERIAGSNLAVMPGALHLSNIEAADLFNSRLAEFLA